jgi:small subunit ribosomal protein S20
LANIKSAEKRWHQSLRRRMRNRAVISATRTYVRATVRTIHAGEPDPEKLRLAIIALDKAAEKGIIHKNNAARRKSRLMSQFAHVAGGGTIEVTKKRRARSTRPRTRARR